jgi:hypothetical protein
MVRYPRQAWTNGFDDHGQIGRVSSVRHIGGSPKRGPLLSQKGKRLSVKNPNMRLWGLLSDNRSHEAGYPSDFFASRQH